MKYTAWPLRRPTKYFKNINAQYIHAYVNITLRRWYLLFYIILLFVRFDILQSICALFTQRFYIYIYSNNYDIRPFIRRKGIKITLHAFSKCLHADVWQKALTCHILLVRSRIFSR